MATNYTVRFDQQFIAAAGSMMHSQTRLTVKLTSSEFPGTQGVRHMQVFEHMECDDNTEVDARIDGYRDGIYRALAMLSGNKPTTSR